VLAEEPSVVSSPPSEVRTEQYNASGIQYAVRYWIEDFGNLERIRDRLMTNVWYSLRRAGVRIPFPARDLFVYSEAPAPPFEHGDAFETLRQVSLFAPLADENLRILAQEARRLTFARAEVVVQEGQPGESFYVIERGRVAVVLGRQDGRSGRTIARLERGDFFGEMSLLAGEPRSATVVAETDTTVVEVHTGAFQQVVVADPAVLEPISQLAARRLEVEAQQAHRRVEVPMAAFESDPAAQRLLNRIKAFFGI
jgi:CRP-like cAMP-binding protein